MKTLSQQLSERGNPFFEVDCNQYRTEVTEMKNINQQTSPAEMSKIVVNQILENVDKQLKEKSVVSK